MLRISGNEYWRHYYHITCCILKVASALQRWTCVPSQLKRSISHSESALRVNLTTDILTFCQTGTAEEHDCTHLILQICKAAKWGLIKTQKSGNPISDRCSPACMSGEALGSSSWDQGRFILGSWQPPGQPEIRVRGSHVTRKELIKSGSSQPSSAPGQGKQASCWRQGPKSLEVL